MNEQLEKTLEFISETLTHQDLNFVLEGNEENSSGFMIAALDKFEYANVGVVTWDKKTKKLFFFRHDQSIENHDVKEGINSEDSKCWIGCPTINEFISHLDGSARQKRLEKMLDKR